MAHGQGPARPWRPNPRRQGVRNQKTGQTVWDLCTFILVTGVTKRCPKTIDSTADVDAFFSITSFLFTILSLVTFWLRNL